MAHIKRNIFFLFLFVVLAAIQISQEVDYTVTNKARNTPGGVRFDTDIGNDYCIQKMEAATEFIWDVFQETNPADRQDVQQVAMLVEDIYGVGAIHTSNNQIHVSAHYIETYSGDIKTEISGVLIHEMTHVWQWNGNGHAPGGLVEGIADFMRLKGGNVPSYWVKPGQGNRWDQGYDVTARFLDYCSSLEEGFVAELNKKMRHGYSDHYFVDLLGKTVDQLWTEYKASNN